MFLKQNKELCFLSNKKTKKLVLLKLHYRKKEMFLSSDFSYKYFLNQVFISVTIFTKARIKIFTNINNSKHQEQNQKGFPFLLFIYFLGGKPNGVRFRFLRSLGTDSIANKREIITRICTTWFLWLLVNFTWSWKWTKYT